MSKEKMEMNQKKDFCPSSEVPLCAGFKARELGSWGAGAGAGLTKK